MKRETTVVYLDYFGTTQKNMETTNWFLVSNEGMYHIIWRLYRLYTDSFPLYYIPYY